MDPRLTVTATDLVNGLGKKELYELFKTLGEERRARAVARAISHLRRTQKIETCQELAALTRKVGADPARVFQALRIAVNDELNNLRSALPQALELLERDARLPASPSDSDRPSRDGNRGRPARQGKLAVISFHSLEDRIVKRQFKEWERAERVKVLTPRVIRPQPEEVARNPRARAAKMRVIKKT